MVEPEGTAAAESPAFACELTDSQAFFTTNYTQEWIVKGLIVSDQPCAVVAPTKSMKTCIVEDLVVSLGSGTRFLNHFDVVRQRACLISGESGERTIQATARNICASRGIDPCTLDVVWGFDLPQFGRPEDLAILKAAIAKLSIRVAVVDPLYLCLLAGMTDQQVSASNMY